MSYKTDMGRVIGLGSAKEGVHHWWNARITSVALIPLTIAFVWIVGPLIGASHAEVVAAFGSPFKAIAVILFILVTFKHLEEGLQIAIEDYVHGKALLAAMLIGNKLLCWALGLAGIFAVAKMAFAG